MKEIGTIEDNINVDDYPAHNAAPLRGVERNEVLTFGDYTAPKHTSLFSCIRRPGNKRTRLDLQPAFIQMLYGSALRGNSTEDPNLHRTLFKSLCQSVRVANEVSTEEVPLLGFPFSLSRKTLEWLYALLADLIHTWDQLADKFMNRFFPAHKTQLAKNKINSFSQEHGESLSEAWERFKEYRRACPHHNFDRYYLLLSFLNGLRDEIRFYISCASGGSLQKLISDELEELIERTASNRTTPIEFSRKRCNVENEPSVPKLETIPRSNFPTETSTTVKNTEGIKGTNSLEVSNNNNLSKNWIRPPDIKLMLETLLQGQSSMNNTMQGMVIEQSDLKKQIQGIETHVKLLDNQRLQRTPPVDGEFTKFADMWEKMKIVQPLQEAIAQTPSYEKFLKDSLVKKNRRGTINPDN
ncbi:PREDICTED: uncharacterized protein LOC104825201 [Tarenaya hassleriana]|uniref:uncharacterized protein LOC104825201 n=1 Tax=Tarenaya hassleriana TaxID=28532 RepID=UPI00053C13AC|nr:PREDICTED: uncharacterized protein LOC104825201 [Tarenaya hassleriana]